MTEISATLCCLLLECQGRIHIGKAKKDEPEIFGEAKHTARNVAELRRVCGKRVAGATFSGKSFERPLIKGKLTDGVSSVFARFRYNTRTYRDLVPFRAGPLS